MFSAFQPILLKKSGEGRGTFRVNLFCPR